MTNIIGLAKSAWQSRTAVLCYHSVSDDRRHRLSDEGVSLGALERQMRMLRRLGYESMTVQELVDAFDTGKPVGKTVVLSFDDGYADTATSAAPILTEYGFRGTVFVITGLVGETAEWVADHGGRANRLATWEQLRSLRRRGWEIGFHGATHRDLTALSVSELANEIDHGMKTFEREMAMPARTMAYPYGRYSSAVMASVERSGVGTAVTVAQSMASSRSHRYALPRCTVRRSDTIIDFLLILKTGYRVRTLPRYALDRSTWSRGYRGSTY